MSYSKGGKKAELYESIKLKVPKQRRRKSARAQKYITMHVLELYTVGLVYIEIEIYGP